jgi:hypothetical protein
VESGVGYLKKNAIAGHCFASWEAFEAHLAKWEREVERSAVALPAAVRRASFERRGGLKQLTQLAEGLVAGKLHHEASRRRQSSVGMRDNRQDPNKASETRTSEHLRSSQNHPFVAAEPYATEPATGHQVQLFGEGQGDESIH